MNQQSKKDSLIESLVNTLFGYVLTLIASPIIYWACDVEMNMAQMSIVTLLFTVVSIARNYVIRRWFNKKSKEPQDSIKYYSKLELVLPELLMNSRIEKGFLVVDSNNSADWKVFKIKLPFGFWKIFNQCGNKITLINICSEE